MKKLLLSICLLSTVGAFAQQSNKEAVAIMEQKGYFGHFGYQLDEIHNINVNYAITPRVPTNEIQLTLHTPEPRPLSLVIEDMNGNAKLTWKPQQAVYLHETKVDVSALPAGKYKYVIMWADKNAFEIPFEKK